MNSLLFLVLLALPFIYCQTKLLSRCEDTVYGSLCLDITSKECFEITGTISIEGQALYGPTSIPISTILSQIEKQKDDPNSGNLMCFPLAESIFGSCELCATVDQLNISGSTIHYCGAGSLNCTSMIGSTFHQEIQIPCFDLKNCGLFNCRNQCNHKGRCTSLGLCECNKGYYGYDCSVHITENCLISLIDTSCWELYSTECDVVTVQVVSTLGHYYYNKTPMDELKNFSIISPTNVINEANLKCDLALSMSDIHSQDSDIIGCPSIVMECNSIEASRQQLDCLTIGTAPDTCTPDNTNPNNPNNNPDGSSDEPQPASSSSNQIYYIIAPLLILVFISLGFLVMKKFGRFGRKASSNTSSVDVYLPEDEEPLNEA